MATFFSEFFTLGSAADDFQKRVYTAISGAQNISECYVKLYEYMIASIGWWSKTQRHDLLDSSIDLSMRDDDKFHDAETHFGDFLVLEEAVLFEYLKVVGQSAKTYGPGVYSLEFDSTNVTTAQNAYRQVQLYQRVKIYNEEYEVEDDYHQKNLLTTKAPPNGKITIDPSKPVNPDDGPQLATLKKGVDDLVTWIEQNYPEYKAVVDAAADGIYELVFSNPDFSLEETVAGLAAMLDKICAQRNSAANSTRNAFGRWMIAKLNEEQAFWNNPAISKAFGSITSLSRSYQSKPHKYTKMFEAFNKLFADFLEGEPYDSETEEQAEQRRNDALGKLKVIFNTFDDPSGDVFKGMMENALVKIKTDQGKDYVSNVRRALVDIPAASSVKTQLPKELREPVKVKADEILQELPLQLDGTDVNFFVIPDYEELKAMSDNSVQVLRGMELKSSVRVNADPDENEKEMDRPIYRTIRFGNTEDRYIAFCNLERAVPGTFYYTKAEFPAIMTIEAKFPSGKIETTTIDFQNYTIFYKDKIDKTKDENGQFYRELGKTSRFFEELRKISPWTTIAAVRRYDPYYTTTPTGVKNSVVHLSGFVAAGRGASRTWPLHDDSLCLWFWNVMEPDLSEFSRLGEILGLPIKRQIVPARKKDLRWLDKPDKTCSVTVGDTQNNFKNYGPRQFGGKGFYFRIIGITEMGEDEQFYVQVNTPTSGVAATLTKEKGTKARASRRMEDNPGAILDRFNFSYFRRITAVDKLNKEKNFSADSKVIQLFKPEDNRKPSGPGIEKIDSPKADFDAVGLNLPICFNLGENIIQYYKDKATRGKIINKGNMLFRAEGSRLDAGTAMKPIYPLIQLPMSLKLSSSKIPATAFSNGAMRQSKSQREDWGLLKAASCNYLPISQEWCHLRGHGDGGNEYPGNFVSGSIHCNTEQLAIETGQRLVTQQMPKKSFYLYTTAYLLRDAINYKSRTDTERQSQILSGNYLQNSDTYKKMLEVHTSDRSTELNVTDGPATKRPRVDTGVQKKSPEQGDVAPVAAYLRYKVMRSEEPRAAVGGKRPINKVDDKRKKHFDFIFEGQSEFIDIHQFNLISQAVQFALAGEVAFTTWYLQEKTQLDAKKTTS